MRFAASLMVCIAASVGWWLGQRQAQPERVAAPVVRAESGAALQLAGSTLSPSHTPLASIHAELVQRAQAGEAAAAMRLYLELERCRSHRILRDYRAQREPSAPASENALRSLDAQRMLACLNEQICAGISVAQESAWIDWLVVAAKAGDPGARWKFAEGRFLSSGVLTALQHAPLYRKQALPWMQGLAQAGYPGVLLLLAQAYLQADDGIHSPLAQLVEQDRVHGAALLHAYALAMAPPGTPEVDALRLRALMPGAAITDAESTAAAPIGMAFYQRHLQEQRIPYAQQQPGTNLLATMTDIARLAPQCLNAERM